MVFIFTIASVSTVMAQDSAEVLAETQEVLTQIMEEGLEVRDGEGNIIPRAYYEWWEFSNSAPAAGTYNVGGNTQKINVELNQKIASFAFSKLAQYLLYGTLGGSLAANTGLLLRAGMTEYFDYLNDNLPDGKTLFVKKTLWSNGNPDTTSNPMEYYYKIRLIYYTNDDFNTEVSRDNFYGTLYIQNH